MNNWSKQVKPILSLYNPEGTELHVKPEAQWISDGGGKIDVVSGVTLKPQLCPGVFGTLTQAAAIVTCWKIKAKAACSLRARVINGTQDETISVALVLCCSKSEWTVSILLYVTHFFCIVAAFKGPHRRPCKQQWHVQAWPIWQCSNLNIYYTQRCIFFFNLPIGFLKLFLA